LRDVPEGGGAAVEAAPRCAPTGRVAGRPPAWTDAAADGAACADGGGATGELSAVAGDAEAGGAEAAPIVEALGDDDDAAGSCARVRHTP